MITHEKKDVGWGCCAVNFNNISITILVKGSPDAAGEEPLFTLRFPTLPFSFFFFCLLPYFSFLFVFFFGLLIYYLLFFLSSFYFIFFTPCDT